MDATKNHWEKIYSSKNSSEVSWTQEIPSTSLNFIHSFNLPKSASIIDIGGGDSKLVDCLLNEGFTNLTVLDISEHALDRTKNRLGEKAKLVKWIVADITEFVPKEHYTVWHDRATFHFLTTPEQIAWYISRASEAINNQGYMTIGTFSENGPTRCSGLNIKQYSETDLQTTLKEHFNKIRCIHEDHITPFQTVQNFLFCSFSKKAA